MKKMICLVLVLTMLLGMTVFASAEGEGLTFKVSSTEAAPGEETQVQVSIENNPGLAAVELVVEFDTAVLEWIEPAKPTEAQEDYDGMWDVFVRNGETGVTVQWFGTGDNYYNDGLFCTLKFKVKDDAPVGESPVTLSFKEETVYNEDEVDVPYTFVPGKVTVTGSEEPTEGLTFKVSSTEAAPGEETQVQVSIENNPGLAAVELVVEFDTAVLEWIEPAKPTEAQEDYDGMWDVFVRNGETGVTVQWFGTGDNYYNDGLFCTLKFKVKDDAPVGESPVTLSFKEETVYNEDEVDVPYTFEPGKVTVLDPGPAAEVYGSNVSLKGNIIMNFYLILPEELTGDAGAYVTVNDEKFLISEAKTRASGSDTLYTFTVELHVKQLNDPYTLKVFTGEDVQYRLAKHSNGKILAGNEYVYSVQTYIEKTLNNPNSQDSLKALVKALSDFGSLAQAQFNYNTDNRVDVQGDLNSVTLESLAAYAEQVTANNEEAGLSFKGSSLVLESATTIRVYFELAEGTDIKSFTFKVNGSKKTPVETENGWMIEIPNVPAKDLDKTYTVIASKGGAAVCTVKTSALSYAYKVLSKEDVSDTLVDLVKGMVLYNAAANEYFAK